MSSEAVVVAVLESMPEYVDLFKKAFPNDTNPISYDNMARAIGAFERGLMTPSSGTRCWPAIRSPDRGRVAGARRPS